MLKFLMFLLLTVFVAFVWFVSPAAADGNPGFIAVGEYGHAKPAHADPVFDAACTTAPAMLAWLHSEPDPQPSAGVFAILKGEEATMLLMLTGGASLATGDRIIYMFHAPQHESYAVRMAAFAMLADSSGCLIQRDGSRTPAAGQAYSGVTFPLPRACSTFAAVGIEWFRCKDGRPVRDGI